METVTNDDAVFAVLWCGLAFGALMLVMATFLLALIGRGLRDAYLRAKMDDREREALEGVEAAIGRSVLAVPLLGPWMRRRYASRVVGGNAR